MAAIEVRNLSFTYPTGERKALEDVSFDVDSSEFVVVCGKSGCGKSTLLRQLKKNLVPYGAKEGGAYYEGIDITELEDRVNASEIGFVQQNPDNQIVTDKVWHELAFGLENLGEAQAVIRRRVSETAAFFGMQTWFEREVSTLSGGQKQLLNLASVVVMQPKVLLLDEPTAQLDPIASTEFMQMIDKIHRELGTTIIMVEHALEGVLALANRLVILEKGQVVANAHPQNVGQQFQKCPTPFLAALPVTMQLYAQLGGEEVCPLTVEEGQRWLEKMGFVENGRLTKKAGDGSSLLF